ncbi:hypothetical protein BTA51_28755 [Hahella sp. CCB-MM4]|uniref:6,7-dimethyl-8-ribityllumazine synthase n=1 Tax=Hahella sp. (strain CCB-MM4) TaxID=1926491 RepID=UPI000B9A3A6F|nr:6,7-dimethyl-8-ribityllumazine synthase [Hahella sp. CCB-MM4]OZG69904.1 hypothetical protein BTA51_28755 [Hahella sp. CCB-MM4]
MYQNGYNLDLESNLPRFSYDEKKIPHIPGSKISIIQTKFYSEYTDSCVDKFEKIMMNAGVKKSDMTRDMIPGTLEVPLAARTIVRSIAPSAIAFFGGVVDTDTKHAEMIMQIFSQEISEVILQTDTPILVGLIYVPKVRMLIDRCEDNSKNYGIKIAQATAEIVSFRLKYQKYSRHELVSPSLVDS